MATAIKQKKAVARKTQPSVLYLYGISKPARAKAAIRAEGIDGSAAIEPLRIGEFVCWVSRVARDEFADRLPENMENLEWLATVGVRHQRAVAELAARVDVLPARFGTVFLGEKSLAEHVASEKNSIQSVFKKIAGAEEWGVKVFRTRESQVPAMVQASSGTDYLKRKAESVMPRKREEDPALLAFVQALDAASVASAPGGKASSGQNNLVWHGSFLVRRSAQKKFGDALKKHTAALAGGYRVECSGPWPPYSFVGQHG